MSDVSTTLKQLEWRAAVKQYRPEQVLSDEQVDLVRQALNLSPSAFGLQPYKIVQVNDEKARAQLAEAGYGQPQITTADVVFVLASRTEMTEKDVDIFADRIKEVRGVTDEDIADYVQTMKGSIASKSDQENAQWAARQVYIPLGFAMAAAAINGIDASPMEGFDAGAVDTLLGLDKQGYTSRALLAIGLRSDEDSYSAMKKVRKDLPDLIETV